MELTNTENFPQKTVHNQSDVMLADKLSIDDEVIVSHLQGLVSKIQMASANSCIQNDCVSGPQHFDDLTCKEGIPEDEDRPSEFVLPGLDNNLDRSTHVQKFFAEYYDYMSGFQRIMDKVCQLWPIEPHVGLKSRFLAEILMDMSTVAVYWAQSVSSSTECERKDTNQYAGSFYLADSLGEENCLHAASDCSANINTGLLVGMLVPQIKFLAQQYLRSLGSNLRQGLHEAKIMEFRGFGPDPAPNWIPDKTVQLLSDHSQIGSIEGILNPLFECMWLPWAQSAEFYHHLDVAMVCNQEMLHTALQLKRLATVCFSWAIPTRPVLEYMISMAPHGKIAEIGSGLGYWAALLKKLGADVVAVDDFSESTSQGSLYFPETIPMDGEEFVRQGGAVGRALFFCWPLKNHSQKGSPKHRRTWMLEREMEIPTWPGVHDVFMCFVKHKDTGMVTCAPPTSHPV
ncbi:hypothetical protein GOP47_0001943 [Adiantum capillus-veneris]|uniref:Uncharacterized protein n=1 Tax=Adiantum capillus-veneris TaxID=13818 RepID=A0A9D4V979_ADICA|nr:hypothetical protein GOP47_0001943 [Adiantum capillus-veneris]